MSGSSQMDQFQLKRMDEMCIVIDENDQIIGAETKRNCHLRENINKGLLHLGFSVIIFNMDNELLVQQRSDTKYTFPGHFSDSCSSHPLYIPEEMEDSDALGMRRAALCRLQAELRIPPEQDARLLMEFHAPRSVSNIVFMTRFYHHSPSDEVWGDRKVAYILLVRKNLTVDPEPREVKSYRYLSREQVAELLDRAARGQARVTPWFRTIVEDHLSHWWDHLEDVSSFVDANTIHGRESTCSPAGAPAPLLLA